MGFSVCPPNCSIPTSISTMATFSPQEQQAFKYLFDLADTEQLGVLTGDKAVGFLSKSKLPIETLGEVWQASDQENNGFLTPQGFSLACRLIGHAQQGEAVSEDLINKRGFKFFLIL